MPIQTHQQTGNLFIHPPKPSMDYLKFHPQNGINSSIACLLMITFLPNITSKFLIGFCCACTSFRNKYRRNGKTCGLKCKLDELCSIRQAHHSNNLCNDLQSFLARSGETLSTKKDANLNKIKSSTNVVIKNKEEAKKLIGKTILPSNDKCKI